MNKIKLNCTFRGDTLPKYSSEGDSGMDIHAYKIRDVIKGELMPERDFPQEGYTLQPLERVLIPSGLNIEFADDIDCSVRPRSGMTLKHGIVVQLGLIDNIYRGDIGLIVINLSNEPYTINRGDRVGQLRFSRPVIVELNPVESLEQTNRGDGGFGHTGK